MDLSRLEEREREREEYKTTGLKTVVLKTAGNIEDSGVEDRRGKTVAWKRTGLRTTGNGRRERVE